MGKYFRPIMIVVFYFLSIMIGSFLILILLMLFDYDSFNFTFEEPDCGANYLELMSHYAFCVPIIAGVLTLTMVRVMKMTDFKGAFSRENISWSSAWIPVLGIFFIMYAFDLLLSDILGISSTVKMQNDNLHAFETLGGVLCIFIGAILEELIFREAIIKDMMSNGATAKLAIVFSAICYGILTFDLYYILTRFLLGIFLGIVYLKTKSVILNCIIAIFLSYVSLVARFVFGTDELMLGFPIYYDLALMLLLIYPAYRLLLYYWNELLPSEKKAELEKLVSK